MGKLAQIAYFRKVREVINIVTFFVGIIQIIIGFEILK